MSRQSETGCMIWLGIGFILFIIQLIKKNPIFILYGVLAIGGILLSIFLFDFLKTFLLINFDKSLRNILNYDFKRIEDNINEIKAKNKKIHLDVDRIYKNFIYDLEKIKNQ